MIYIYALISTSDLDLSSLAGLRNPLQIWGQGSLYAVVEENPFADGVPQEEDALLKAVIHHDRIVQAIFEQTPVLPLRFGSQFLDREQLEGYLIDHAALYGEQLAQFQDQAEFTLSFTPRALPSPNIATAPEPAKGRDYFLAKKKRLLTENDRLQTQQDQWIALQQKIQRAYPYSIWVEGETPRAYLLVSFKREPHLHKQILQWEETHSEWQIQVSPPLPPYHFVTLPTAESEDDL